MKLLAQGTATDGAKFNLYLDESAKTEPIVSPFMEVDYATFLKFIQGYPNNLNVDEFMDSASWNDFMLYPKWPESMVAIMHYGRPDLNIPDTYKILKDVPPQTETMPHITVIDDFQEHTPEFVDKMIDHIERKKAETK